MSEYETVFNDEMPPDMFDLGIETGKEWEQARIIKLLEDPATLQGWFTTHENYQGKTMLSYLIALIKGEN